MLPPQQISKDFLSDGVIPDKLRTEPFRSQKQVNCGRILPPHGIGTGKVQIYLRTPSDQSYGDRCGVEGFTSLDRGLRITEPERRGDGVYRDIDMTECGSHMVRIARPVGDAAGSAQAR